ncbi:unnamed protein product [Auanema sp. JU1783]|nr:unnamed protein product [Auanema sp. JU1783]
MIHLDLTLLYGKEPYRTYTTRINQDASYHSLQYEIKKSFHISKRHQQIYFRGKELTVVGHTLQSAEDGEEIIIKHSLYNHWLAFEQHFQNARKATLSNTEVREHALLAFTEYSYLNSSKPFFHTFPHLCSSVDSFLTTFRLYKDSQCEPITQASEAYFSTLYDDDPVCPKLSIKWEKKRSQKIFNAAWTLRCSIYREETLLKTYYVRTHTKLTQPHDNENADLRVLFMYKLLEILGLGPKVHVYRNSGHGFGLYTASERVPDFKSFQFLTDNTDKNTLLYYQVRLLCFCFYLKDLLNDKRNYGADRDGRLKILHFAIRFHRPIAKRQLEMYGFYRGKESRIGKECFSRWDLLRCIDLANKAIENEKNLYKRHPITCEQHRDYDQYLTKIKNNVQYFTIHFHKLELGETLFARCLRVVDPNQIPFRTIFS